MNYGFGFILGCVITFYAILALTDRRRHDWFDLLFSMSSLAGGVVMVVFCLAHALK